MPPPLRPIVVCIPWTGPTRGGYPVENGKRALRALLAAHLGHPIKGMVLHTCWNKLCMNVAHLREGYVRSPRRETSWANDKERIAYYTRKDEQRRRRAREGYHRRKADAMAAEKAALATYTASKKTRKKTKKTASKKKAP